MGGLRSPDSVAMLPHRGGQRIPEERPRVRGPCRALCQVPSPGLLPQSDLPDGERQPCRTARTNPPHPPGHRRESGLPLKARRRDPSYKAGPVISPVLWPNCHFDTFSPRMPPVPLERIIKL